MDVLVPIDGSDPSFAALAFAVEFGERFDATLDVVHVTDYEGEVTREIVARAHELLAEANATARVSVETATDLDDIGASSAIGAYLARRVEDGEYEHVVMGRHGRRRLEGLLVGSASQTLAENVSVPVTLVP